MVARVTLVALLAACLLAAACSSAGAEASGTRRMLVKTSALGTQADYPRRMCIVFSLRTLLQCSTSCLTVEAEPSGHAHSMTCSSSKAVFGGL